MRRTLAGALTLVVVLSGMQSTVVSASARQGLERAGITAHRKPARLPADTGGGVVRKGPFVVQVTEPTLVQAVAGTADIFLAGRRFPFQIHGHDGVDIGGRNNPVEISLLVAAGHRITITTKFGVSITTKPPAGQNPSGSRANDANGYASTILAGPAERGVTRVGVSTVRAPLGGLVGVFIASTPNRGRIPATLDYRSQRSRDASPLRPTLNQVFFIGTGLTSLGSKKQYVVPPGAVKLALAPLDTEGDSFDNHGTILAFITGTKQVSSEYLAVPTSTATATNVPSTATPTNTITPSATTTPLPTDTSTVTVTSTPTNTATWTVTVTPTPTATNTATNTPTNTGTNTATNTATNTPVNTATFPQNIPTVTFTPIPTVPH